mgnify:CR=1 FL=1
MSISFSKYTINSINKNEIHDLDSSKILNMNSAIMIEDIRVLKDFKDQA